MVKAFLRSKMKKWGPPKGASTAVFRTKNPWADKKLVFFENLKRLDVQNDLYANGRVGFRKAVPAFCRLLGAGSRLHGAG